MGELMKLWRWISFTLICILKAIADGFNFVVPHNSGFFSLTDGWFDAWHLCFWFILLIIGINFVGKWSKLNWRINMLKFVAFGAIAYVVQRFIYNFLFKLLELSCFVELF